MAISFERVRPGDVITSDLINRIIDKIEELDGRSAAGTTNTGGTDFNFQFDPALQQAVGQPLTLIGTFDFPLGQNTIRVDGTQIPISAFLPGSDATHISFMIPTSINVPGATRGVTVSVQTTTKGQKDKTYLLAKQVQSAIPDPTITSVTNFDDPTPGALLQTGKRASINGNNLSNATVVFKVQTGPGTFVTHPAPTIDTANSTAVRLVVTVPPIPENAQGDIPVIVEVTISGAINKASKTATLMSA
jgi:hypothetical protein